jgi:energy-coupling factor transporter ATP-binding protein EcfA2
VTPSIALIGRMGSGKTTIAKALEDLGYNRHSWAAPAKTVASWAYGPVNKARLYEVTLDGKPTTLTGREILQRMATEGIRRSVDEDFWVRIGVNALDAYPEHGPFVCDDTRFPNEVDALARRGWVIVRILVPEELREARLTELYGPDQPNGITGHASETALDHVPVHLTLWNTASPTLVAETLLNTISQAIEAGATFTNREAA